MAHDDGVPLESVTTACGTVTLRRRDRSDDDFLRALYASTRLGDLGTLLAGDDRLAALLSLQYDAQDAHYRRAYPNADFCIVLLDGEPVGRLCLDRSAAEVRLIDISLLPQVRGRGVGSALLAALIAAAQVSYRPLVASVAATNPARALYARLGFREVADDGVYVSLVHGPAAARRTPYRS